MSDSIPRTTSIDSFFPSAEEPEFPENRLFPSAIEPEFPETRHKRPRGWSSGDPWTREDMEYLHIFYTRQMTGRALGCSNLPAYDAFQRRWGSGIHPDNLIDIRQ